MKKHDDEIDRITDLMEKKFIICGRYFPRSELRNMVAAVIASYVPQYEWSEEGQEANLRASPIQYAEKIVTLHVTVGARRFRYSGRLPLGVEDTSAEERLRRSIVGRSGASLLRWIMTGAASDDA